MDASTPLQPPTQKKVVEITTYAANAVIICVGRTGPYVDMHAYAALERQLAAAQLQTAAWRRCAEFGWTVIANAGGGNWDRESDDWRKAATLFRDNNFYPCLDLDRQMGREPTAAVDAVAHPSYADLHNPDNLTPQQVGVAEGWRLLAKDEIKRRRDCPEIQAWVWRHPDVGEWLDGRWAGADPETTYRTWLTPEILARVPATTLAHSE